MISTHTMHLVLRDGAKGAIIQQHQSLLRLSILMDDGAQWNSDIDTVYKLFIDHISLLWGRLKDFWFSNTWPSFSVETQGYSYYQRSM